jgi:nitroreductase
LDSFQSAQRHDYGRRAVQRDQRQSGIAVFLGASADPQHWFLSGRACQRFALQVTALGLKTAFINQPVEVAPLRPELAALLGLPGRRPDLVLRFGYGPTLPFSPRRAPNLVG